MSSILIVRTSAIGDVIQTLPVLEYLCKKFPHAQIDWIVEKAIAPLLEQIEIAGVSPLKRILAADIKRWAKSPFARETRQEAKRFYQTLCEVKYDLLFDLQGNTKSGFFTGAALAEEKIGFGWKSAREKTNLLVTDQRFEFPLEMNIRQKYLGLVQSYFGDEVPFISSGLSFRLSEPEQNRLDQILQEPTLQHKPRLMIAVGSKWRNKRLNEETLFAFLKNIAEQIDPSYLFIHANAEEKLLANRLSETFPNRSRAIGELSLPLWQALMRHSDGIIAVDSAALHLAATAQIPSFSIFGPTRASLFKPLEEHHHAYQGSCPYGRAFLKQCPVLRTCPTGACIHEIRVDELMRAFEKWAGSLVYR